jgi:hypothetical protein
MSPRTRKAQRILIARAKARDLITYGALANMIGMSPRHIGGMLTAIHNGEHAAGRPSLATLVLSGDDLARRKNAWWDYKDNEWHAERRRLYAYWNRRR